MSFWKESLSIASSTLVIGTVAYFGAPSAAPWSTLLGGTAAATGTHAIWAKKRQQALQQQANQSPKHEPTISDDSVIIESPVKSDLAQDQRVQNQQSDSTINLNPPTNTETDIAEIAPPNPIETEDVGQPPEPNKSAPPVLDLPEIPAAIAPIEDITTPTSPQAQEGSLVSTDLEPEEGSSKTVHPVVAKLHALDIDVKNYSEPRPSDVLFDQSALMLGDRYPELSRCFVAFANRYRYFDGLVQKFDDGIFDKAPSNVFFCRFTSTDDNYYRALCHDFFALLKKNTLIRDVRWSYKDQDLLIVSFQKNRDASVLQFINGFWLETICLPKNQASLSHK